MSRQSMGDSRSMTYDEAVAYLESFTNYEQRHQPQAMRQVRLERMQQLCDRLGEPQRRFRCVLVTGTNGKGSICAMLYSMLRESPLRVGLYTSPHLEHLRERIRVWDQGPCERAHGDDWILEEEFAAGMERLQPVVERMREDSCDGPPTYFEVLTALAFAHFARRQVDIAVLEVGLGGRLDATNVAEPVVSIIGPIDVDHADVLGADPVAIAREKAGIIKPRQTVITAPQQEGVLPVLRAVCDERAAMLLEFGRDLTASILEHNLEGLVASVTALRGIYDSLEIPLLGRHQARNAALAVAALEALSHTGVPYTMVAQGLARVEWPGRIEVVHDVPLVIMDGAHNPHAAQALRETLEELSPGRPIHLLIGMSADKSITPFIESFRGIATGATCARSRHPRAMDAATLAGHVVPSVPDVHAMSDPADAYTYVLNAVSPDHVIVVTGSLFLVGQIRAALRTSHVRPRRSAVAA